MLLANFNRKEHLRHRAVSLRQHGFLVVSAVAKWRNKVYIMQKDRTPKVGRDIRRV